MKSAFPPLPFTRAAFVLTIVATSIPCLAQDNNDEQAVKDVIVAAYVEGLHQNSDAEAGMAGFHPEFIMHFNREGEVVQITRDQWFSRLNGEKNENEITHEFAYVDVTGDVASAKIRMYSNGEHIFTDYMGLYRGEDGWKIVNKVFQSH
jgi:hypothetical protein